MPTTKNIMSQMVSVGDPISQKKFQVKSSNGYHVGRTRIDFIF